MTGTGAEYRCRSLTPSIKQNRLNLFYLFADKLLVRPIMPASLSWAPGATLSLALIFFTGEASLTLVRFYRTYYTPAVGLSPKAGARTTICSSTSPRTARWMKPWIG